MVKKSEGREGVNNEGSYLICANTRAAMAPGGKSSWQWRLEFVLAEHQARQFEPGLS